MLSVKDIAMEALSAVSAEIAGVVKSGIIRRNQTSYDPSTGETVIVSDDIEVVAVKESERAMRDYFPDYVISGGEEVWIVVMEGGVFEPKEADLFIYDGVTKRVMRSVDILAVGQMSRILVV